LPDDQPMSLIGT